MANVLIYEPYISGHRMVYVRYILNSMARYGGLRVILATSSESASNRYVAELAEEFASNVRVAIVEPPRNRRVVFHYINKIVNQFEHFFGFFNIVKKFMPDEPVDYVFIPFIDDYLLFPLALSVTPFRRIPWGGIVIRPRFHLSNMGARVPKRRLDLLERVLYRLLLRNKSLSCIFSIDPFLKKYFHNDKLLHIADPSDIHSVVPEKVEFGMPSDAVVLLVYGYLDERKGLDRLLFAVMDDRVSIRTNLLLVGEQDMKVANLLRSDLAQRLRAQGRLFEVNRRVSDAEEAAAFRRADIVWVYYPGNYSCSGALVRAGQTSCPVIATREGLVGLIVSEVGMGLTAAEYDDEELVMALARLSGNATLRADLGNAGYEHFSRATPEVFADPIAAHIANALGQ